MGNSSNHYCKKQQYNLQLYHAAMQIHCNLFRRILLTDLNMPIIKIWSAVSLQDGPRPNGFRIWLPSCIVTTNPSRTCPKSLNYILIMPYNVFWCVFDRQICQWVILHLHCYGTSVWSLLFLLPWWLTTKKLLTPCYSVWWPVDSPH